MRLRALMLGAAIVLAAVVGLLAVLCRNDASDARRDGVPKITQADPGKPASDGAHAQRAAAAPVARAPDAPSALPDPAVTDYMVGGRRIRDHRPSSAGLRAPIDVPPAIHPPEGRKIPSQLTSAIAQQIRAVMSRCAMNLPSDARGAEPRLEGTIAIAIADHRAKVTSATVQLRDVSADAALLVKQCIEQRSVGVSASAGDEPDVTGYSIALAFRLE